MYVNGAEVDAGPPPDLWERRGWPYAAQPALDDELARPIGGVEGNDRAVVAGVAVGVAVGQQRQAGRGADLDQGQWTGQS